MKQGCRILKTEELSAIICGGEATDHTCDNKDIVYTFSDGFKGSVFDKAKIEKLNLQLCEEDKLHFLAEKGIYLTGGGVACSICKRSELDNLYNY